MSSESINTRDARTPQGNSRGEVSWGEAWHSVPPPGSGRRTSSRGPQPPRSHRGRRAASPARSTFFPGWPMTFASRYMNTWRAKHGIKMNSTYISDYPEIPAKLTSPATRGLYNLATYGAQYGQYWKELGILSPLDMKNPQLQELDPVLQQRHDVEERLALRWPAVGHPVHLELLGEQLQLRQGQGSEVDEGLPLTYLPQEVRPERRLPR